MPNVNRGLSAFMQGGNPDTVNVSLSSPPVPGSFTPYAPGDLGTTFEYQDKAYTPVIVDSGATAATPTGTVLANQLLYWKDKANRIVTNDHRVALGGQTTNAWRNFVAGVARVAVGAPGTGGNLIFMLVRGYNIPVLSNATGGIGQVASADSTDGQVIGTAVGTMPGYLALGVERSAVSSGSVNVDLDVPILP